MTDLILAITHHVFVFGLVTMMMGTRVLLRGPEVDPVRLARLDAGAGVLSALVLAVGVCRVIWGGKGWAFYEANPFFWGKIACFVVIGALTVPGTIAFLKWRRAAAADAGFRPDLAQVARLRTLTGLQALVLIPLLGCAAAMARYPF